MRDIVEELAAEQSELENVLRGLTPEQWRFPTPAEGWDVRDQVSHLADSEEMAYDTATGGPRQLNEEALTYPSPEAFTESGCDKGRAMEPADVLDWWLRTSTRTREMLVAKDPKERFPWGLGMSARAFATARLMETWAHGLDVRAAVGLEPNITPRLRNVAWLVTNAVPYAFVRAERPKPEGTLRVALNAPDGSTWTFGPEEATDTITGDAAEYCLVGVQRLPLASAGSLKASGPLAEAALNVLRAFL